MSLADMRVAFAEGHKISWQPIKDTHGFGGVDMPGVYCKFFGKENIGPWFYLVKHEPGVLVERHSHEGDVFHYIIEGEWQIGSKVFGPEFFQFEKVGLNYGPIKSGDKGSLFLAIYDKAPHCLPSVGAEKLASPDAAYE